MAKDYYSILGVSKTATPEELKKAYRKLAHAHHPDKKTGDEAKFKEINEAYSTLSDPAKRQQYDQFGQTFSGNPGGGGSGQGFGGFDFGGFSQSAGGFNFGGANMEDLFSDLFTGGGGRRERSGRGSDIQVDVAISFKEMVNGVRRTVEYRTFVRCPDCQGTGGAPGADEKTCPDCHGKGSLMRNINTILGTFAQSTPCERCHARGRVQSELCRRCHGAGRAEGQVSKEIDIPAGIESGQALSLSGNGAAGEFGAPNGDLYIVVQVRPDAQFSRQGDDIISELPLDFHQFALGDKVSVETVEGPVHMKIPAGTQPGEVFRIRSKGVPKLGRFGRGDQLVRTKIVIPRSLSSEEKRHIEALKNVKKH
ncbi:MAG: molecular chaperone DnaJ [Undibacterium sp.]